MKGANVPVITGDGGIDPSKLMAMFGSKQDVENLK